MTNRQFGLGAMIFGAVLTAWVLHLWFSAPKPREFELQMSAGLGLFLGIICMTTGVSMFTNPGRRS